MLPVDWGDTPSEIIDELVRGRYAKECLEVVKAEANQKRIAREMGEHRAMDGLGQPDMAIDPLVYHAWANKFKTYDCWKDKDFKKYMKRNFEETKVQRARGCNGGTRIQSGWTPAVESCGAKKFHKNYGELKSAND